MSKRGSSRFAKRTVRSLYRRMDTSLSQLQTLHGMFDDGQHIEYCEFLLAIAKAQILIQQSVIDFHRLAWQSVPEDWYSDA